MISVIIPLDSKSKHFLPALDSFFAQENETPEVLIVPTAEDEELLSFAEEIAGGREGVTILPHCMCLADAINIGVSSARGEFVHICTGREILRAGVYAIITESMLQTEADVACFGWQDYNGDQMCSAAFTGTGNMQAYLELILTAPGSSGEYAGYGIQLWNKVFRRDVFFVEDAQILASAEAFGLMGPIWLTKLAVNCDRAVFSAECLLERKIPSAINDNVVGDLTAFYSQQKEALAFAETLSTYAYKRLLQLFFTYETKQLLLCREQKMVKMAETIENHLVDFYGVPFEEKKIIQTFIRAEHQQKSIAGLRREAGIQDKKVESLTTQVTKLEADRTFLKRKKESQEKRIEGLEADRTFLKRKTEGQQNRIESQLKRIEGLEADRTFLKRKTEGQQKRIESQLKRIEGLEADRTFLKRKTENQQKRIEGMDADRTFLKRKTESQQKRIEGLEADRTFLKRKTESQQKRIEGMDADRAFLKRKTESQQKRIEGLEADREFLKRRSEGRQKRIEGLEADRTFLKRRTESQLKRIEGLEADRTFLKRKIEKQLREKEEMETTMFHLKKRKTELSIALAEYEGSFLARTALKLNRWWRKILSSIFSRGKKQ